MKTALHRINLDEIGGVERLFDNFIGASQVAKHHIVLSQPVHPFLERVLNKAKIHNIKWRRGKKLWRPLRRRHAQRIFTSIDAEALIYWDTEERYLEVLRKRKSNVPLFFYDHGTSWLTHKERRFSEFLRHVDLCIACSEASKRMLELRWGVRSPIRVVTNPLRPDLAIDQAKAKTLPKDRPFRIGYVGRLVPAKGHCVALHVLAGLVKEGMDAELHIAGGGKYQQPLEELACALGVFDKTHFLGCIDDVGAFYQSVDLCLNASISEAFGLTSIEAQAFGCVPIVSYTDGLAETIARGKTGIGIIPSLEHDQFPSLGGSMKGFPKFVYDPIEDRLHRPNVMDPNRAITEIIDLVNDPGRYEALSRAGIVHAKEFAFDCYIEKLENLVTMFSAKKKTPSLQIANQLDPSEPRWSHTVYGAFLQRPSAKPLRHNTIASFGHLNAALREPARRAGLGLWEAGFWGPVPLPRWLATQRMHKALQAIHPGLTVHWDCIGALSQGKNLYIDSGAAWQLPDLKGMDEVVVFSKAARRMIEERFAYKGKITQLPLALTTLPEVEPKKRAMHRPFVLGAFAEGGALALHTLKEVLRLGLDAHLLLLGKRADLKKTAYKLGLADRILFLGNTRDIEVFFLGCDMIFASQPSAPVPDLILQALSYGCPVVAPALDALAEIAPVHLLDLNAFGLHLFGEKAIPGCIYDPNTDAITIAKTAHPTSVAAAVVSELPHLESRSAEAITWSKKNLDFECLHTLLSKVLAQ